MLADSWERLGRRLGLDRAILTVFHKENENFSEKALHMLKNWKQSMGVDGTYQVLFDALCHKLVNRKDIAEQICLSQEGN